MDLLKLASNVFAKHHSGSVRDAVEEYVLTLPLESRYRAMPALRRLEQIGTVEVQPVYSGEGAITEYIYHIPKAEDSIDSMMQVSCLLSCALMASEKYADETWKRRFLR